MSDGKQRMRGAESREQDLKNSVVNMLKVNEEGW